jgi:hypothetical protein
LGLLGLHARHDGREVLPTESVQEGQWEAWAYSALWTLKERRDSYLMGSFLFPRVFEMFAEPSKPVMAVSDLKEGGWIKKRLL